VHEQSDAADQSLVTQSMGHGKTLQAIEVSGIVLGLAAQSASRPVAQVTVRVRVPAVPHGAEHGVQSDGIQ